jgi:hypothetical protein
MQPLSILKADYPNSTVVARIDGINGLLSPMGLNHRSAQVSGDDIDEPVTGMFKQHGDPYGGISGWYVSSNLWVTYTHGDPTYPHAKYYHIQSVLAAWVNSSADQTVPTRADNPLGFEMNCVYLQFREGPDSFSLGYGYYYPKGWELRLRLWFKRGGSKGGWVSSNVTGPLRNKYAHLVGWSI